jgi:hypothetical protein
VSALKVCAVVALLGVTATKKKAAPAPAPAAKKKTVPVAQQKVSEPPKKVEPTPVAEPTPPPEPAAPADPWDFDGQIAKVRATGQSTDPLTSAALQQMGLKLEGVAVLKLSVHPNSTGGVTVHVEDPSDAKSACDLYGSKEDDKVVIKDARCVFPVFQDQLRTNATCRKISGTVSRVADKLSLEADAPDCTAQVLGVPISIKASARPLL